MLRNQLLKTFPAFKGRDGTPGWLVDADTCRAVGIEPLRKSISISREVWVEENAIRAFCDVLSSTDCDSDARITGEVMKVCVAASHLPPTAPPNTDQLPAVIGV